MPCRGLAGTGCIYLDFGIDDYVGLIGPATDALTVRMRERTIWALRTGGRVIKSPGIQ